MVDSDVGVCYIKIILLAKLVYAAMVADWERSAKACNETIGGFVVMIHRGPAVTPRI
mgnify:CR=1 FL=1